MDAFLRAKTWVITVCVPRLNLIGIRVKKKNNHEICFESRKPLIIQHDLWNTLHSLKWMELQGIYENQTELLYLMNANKTNNYLSKYKLNTLSAHLKHGLCQHVKSTKLYQNMILNRITLKYTLLLKYVFQH